MHACMEGWTLRVWTVAWMHRRTFRTKVCMHSQGTHAPPICFSVFVLSYTIVCLLSLSLGLCRRASRCLSLSLSRFALFYNVLSPSCKPVRLGLGFHAPVPLRLVVVTAAAGDPCSKNPPPRLRSSASVGCHPAADPEDIIKLYTETLNL